MKAAAILLALMVGGCTLAPDDGGNAPSAPMLRADFAQESANQILRTEGRFAAAAQRDGQWTAFAAFAAPDARLFVPQPVNAQDWLRGRANPAVAVRWQPHRVIISCDGTLAATFGAVQHADGRNGWFTTIWQRQDDGAWKWVADNGGFVSRPIAAPDSPAIEVAECPGALGPPDFGPANDFIGGASDDRSLLWDWLEIHTNSDRTGLRATMWIGTRYVPTITPFVES